ncbi:MAG: glycosyltransferase [Taibaiella sp.]|nr:glycosyltransferase [Taibaiella sp.]
MSTISIITICFNNLEEVIKTCASVDAQGVKPFEHIVIDGSSKEDIRKYLGHNPQPAYRSWVCERDKGIGDAFNKGVLKAKGEIVYLLNSGDTIYDATVLQRVQDTFDKDPQLMWCNGKLNTLRGGIWVLVGKPFEKRKLYRGMRAVFHPTMYVKKEVYKRHGLYDNDIKYAMDYDFMCRIANEKNTFINYPLATFDPTGISSVNYLKAMKESHIVYRKYYGNSILQTLWGIRQTMLHYTLQSKAGKILYRIKKGLGLENM